MVVNPFEIAISEEDEHWEGDFHDEDVGDSDEDEDYDGAGGLANGSGGGVDGRGRHYTNGHDGHSAAAAAAASPGRRKMKKMSMATHREYSRAGDVITGLIYRSPRFVCFVGLFCCVLILMVIASAVRQSSQDTNGTGSEEPECLIHTTDEPFSEWMHHIKISNSSELCRDEVRLLFTRKNTVVLFSPLYCFFPSSIISDMISSPMFLTNIKYSGAGRRLPMSQSLCCFHS